MCIRRHLSKYERAALIVKNALHGRRLATPTLASVNAQRVYHSAVYRILYAMLTVAYLLLALAEAPSALPVSDAVRGFVHALDFAYLLLVVFDIGLQFHLHGGRVWLRRGWVQVRSALVLAMLLNLIVRIARGPSTPYPVRALRPLFLIERLRNVRRVAGNIASTVPKVANVMILLVLHVLFFSVLGYVLFAGVDGVNCTPFRAATAIHCSTFDKTCSNYFSSLEETAMQLFELLTAANYPAVMMPVYRCNRASILFFLAFIVIGIYLLLSLTLAVTYATFKSLMAKEVLDKYRRMFDGFDMAFVVLTDDDSRDSDTGPGVVRNPLAAPTSALPASNPLPPGLPEALSAVGASSGKRSSLLALVGDALGQAFNVDMSSGTATDDTSLSKADFLKFFRCLRPDVELDCAEQFFDVFDSDAQGRLYRMEFRRLILNFGKLSVKRSKSGHSELNAMRAVDGTAAPASPTVSAPTPDIPVIFSPLRGAPANGGTTSSLTNGNGGHAFQVVNGSDRALGATNTAVPNITSAPTAAATTVGGGQSAGNTAASSSIALRIASAFGREGPLPDASITDDLMGDAEGEDLEVLDAPVRHSRGGSRGAGTLGLMLPVEEVTDEEEEDSSAYSPSTISRGMSNNSLQQTQPSPIANPLAAMAGFPVARELSFPGGVPQGRPSASDQSLQRAASGLRQNSSSALLNERSSRVVSLMATENPLRTAPARDEVDITSSPPLDDTRDTAPPPKFIGGSTPQTGTLTGTVVANPTRLPSAPPDPANVVWWNTRHSRNRAWLFRMRDACQVVGHLLAVGLSSQTTADGHGTTIRRTASMRAALPRGVSAESWRGRGVLFCRQLPVTLFFDIVVLLNTVAVLYYLSIENDEVDLTGDPGMVAMRNIEYVMLSFFMLEVIGKLVFWGPKQYWKESGFHRLDLLLVAAAFIGTILQAGNIVNKQVSSVISFFRFIRLVRVLRVLPGFGLTVAAFADILPVLLQYVTVILSSFYCFAIIGVESFAGVLTESNAAVADSAYGQSGYFELTFDTVPSAMVTQLYLLVLNDWPIVMEGTVAALGRGARIFFVLFWLINVVISLNVVVAFVIESFSVQKLKRETIKRYEEEGKLLAEYGISQTVIRQRAQRHGLHDWRDVILRSGLDFSRWRLSRKAHHFDIYDELYKSELRSAFADTFSLRRRGSNRPSISGNWPPGLMHQDSSDAIAAGSRAAHAAAAIGARASR